jgi:hypothetical protein
MFVLSVFTNVLSQKTNNDGYIKTVIVNNQKFALIESSKNMETVFDALPKIASYKGPIWFFNKKVFLLSDVVSTDNYFTMTCSYKSDKKIPDSNGDESVMKVKVLDLQQLTAEQENTIINSQKLMFQAVKADEIDLNPSTMSGAMGTEFNNIDFGYIFYKENSSLFSGLIKNRYLITLSLENIIGLKGCKDVKIYIEDYLNKIIFEALQPSKKRN